MNEKTFELGNKRAAGQTVCEGFVMFLVLVFFGIGFYFAWPFVIMFWAGLGCLITGIILLAIRKRKQIPLAVGVVLTVAGAIMLAISIIVFLLLWFVLITP